MEESYLFIQLVRLELTCLITSIELNCGAPYSMRNCRHLISGGTKDLIVNIAPIQHLVTFLKMWTRELQNRNLYRKRS